MNFNNCEQYDSMGSLLPLPEASEAWSGSGGTMRQLGLGEFCGIKCKPCLQCSDSTIILLLCRPFFTTQCFVLCLTFICQGSRQECPVVRVCRRHRHTQEGLQLQKRQQEREQVHRGRQQEHLRRRSLLPVMYPLMVSWSFHFVIIVVASRSSWDIIFV